MQNISSTKNNFSECPLEEILPHTLMSVPAPTVQSTEKMWVVTAMCCSYLESFTDAILVMQDNKPLGIVAGRETLRGVLKNPSFEYFDRFTAGQALSVLPTVITPQTILSDLILNMERQRFGFAVIPYNDGGYAAISVRMLLEIAALSEIEKKASDIPKKFIVTFRQNDTIENILKAMFQNQTRRLVQEDHSCFISDRLIIEKIATKLNYLDGVSDFLKMKVEEFPQKKFENISEDLPIPELAKKMLGMETPYVLIQDRIISPWDVAILLR